MSKNVLVSPHVLLTRIEAKAHRLHDSDIIRVSSEIAFGQIKLMV